MPLPLPSQTPVAYTEYEDNSQHHTGRYNYGGSSSHTIPASEQLSAFEQTLKEDDERFYRQFPAARGAADNPWTMVDNSPLGGYAFSYHGSSGTGKSWKDCASAESSSSWSQASPQQLVIDATAPEAAAVEHESPSFTHHHPSYALSGALVPSPPLHYDYTGHVRFDSSSPPETVISAQEGPSSPVYASYSEPVHSSLHASPVLQEAPFYNTFPTHPQPTYDYDAYYPPPTSYGRKIKEEPIMDYLEPPSSPTPDLATSTPSPSETSSHILYPLSQASSPGLYSSSTGEMVPLTRKARGHAMPIPNNPNARSFYYKLARPGTSHATQHPPMVTSYSRRTPVPVNASKAADKKPPLACFFCRQRKIACSAPAPESHDKTCNQCSRRKLICEYPKESRRGMRKNSKKNTTGDTPAPPLQQPNTKGT